MEGQWDQGPPDAVAEVLSLELPRGSESLLRGYVERAADQNVIYLSHPITTGSRLIEWRKKVAAGTEMDSATERERITTEVVGQNIRSAEPIRRKVEAEFSGDVLIDPSELDSPHWQQRDYHRFWAEVILRCVDRVVFVDGWEYSNGCAVEYATALEFGIETVDSGFAPLDPRRAEALLSAAAKELDSADLPNAVALAVAQRCSERVAPALKDERLATIAASFNVASFVSFSRHLPRLRYQVTSAGEACQRAAEPEEAIRALFNAIRGNSVNVRTFLPNYGKSLPFEYGITSVEEAARRVRDFARRGLFTIVNETVDIHDGGVSGVTLGGIAEFAPDDTPRAVEKPGAATLPLKLADRMLSTVYGVPIKLPYGTHQRFEFSVHPARVGCASSHLLVWEVEEIEPVTLEAEVSWPNRFSSLVGDKTFGLLIADLLGAPVPETTVVSRRIAPFRFGRKVGTGDHWLRTAPAVQEPGKFTTQARWTDPFELLAREDPGRGRLAAVLAQEGVDAVFSGATTPILQGGDVIEGVSGHGDNFMLGLAQPTDLPAKVTGAVSDVLRTLQRWLGAVRIEWAADQERVWVLQLHRIENPLPSGVLSPGEATDWIEFDPDEGLETLSELIQQAKQTSSGILVMSPIGITSHVGDVLRKAAVPGRLAT